MTKKFLRCMFLGLRNSGANTSTNICKQSVNTFIPFNGTAYTISHDIHFQVQQNKINGQWRPYVFISKCVRRLEEWRKTNLEIFSAFCKVLGQILDDIVQISERNTRQLISSKKI
jgi:hypothetical protein